MVKKYNFDRISYQKLTLRTQSA